MFEAGNFSAITTVCQAQQAACFNSTLCSNCFANPLPALAINTTCSDYQSFVSTFPAFCDGPTAFGLAQCIAQNISSSCYISRVGQLYANSTANNTTTARRHLMADDVKDGPTALRFD